MNYNLITYLFYFAIMVGIIYRVGWVCFKNGESFILDTIHDKKLTQTTNKLLLAGYYLVNIGFVIYTIAAWPQLHSSLEIVVQLSKRVGFLLVLLASLHYFNIYFITHLLKKIIKS